ncbi:T9SS type A sorting domain-containing protein [bacterium]|nr:T9SS type A sorting domain-containing protein [bacterium]
MLKKMKYLIGSVCLLVLMSTVSAFADVSAVGAVLGTTTVNTASQYTVTFTTGGSGALTAASNDTIVITFPTNTTVPASVSTGANITVNGSNITTAASGSGQTLTITTPVDVGNSAGVTVIIASAAGVINPSTPGSAYALNVHTNIESTDIASGTYSITASTTALSVGAVTVTPNTIGNDGQYSFAITTAADGALISGSGQIMVTFPGTTNVPATFAGTDITVGGTNVATASGAGQVVTITTPIALNASTAYTIIFTTNANIRNPTTTGAGYTLTASTTAQTTAGTSPPYTIAVSSNALSVGAVTVNPNTIGNDGQYSFDITTAADGALISGSGQIMVTFPGTTNVPATFAGTDITVGGTNVATASGAGQVVTITTPIALNASTAYTIIFTTNANIRNPTTTGAGYTLTASTTVQTTAGTSLPYTIAVSSNTLSVGAVTVTPNTISNIGQYSFDITTAADGAILSGDSIVVTFPAGTVVPAAYAVADITVGGNNVATAGGSGQVVTITSPIALSAGTAYTIVFTTAADIRNPSTALGTYQISASTTVQTTAGNSPPYTIAVSSTPLSVGTVAVTPNTITNIGQYSFDITTHSDGAILSGDNIVVTFPAGTTVPTTYSSGDITVGGNSVSTAGGSGQTVTITSPIALSASTAYTIIFTTAASIQNPGTAGSTYQLSASTTVQTTAGNSPNYTIAASSNPLTVGAVTVTPNTVSNIAQYSFPITTAVDGALVSGSGTVSVTFPAGTIVPTTYSGGDITIGGTSVTVASGAGQTVTFTTPIALNASTAYTIIFTSAANIRNPAAIGSTYQLSASTSVQTIAGNSQNYTISASTIQLTVGAVTVSPSTIGNDGEYDITITTAADGTVVGGAGTVTVTFPAGTNVPAAFAAGDLRIGTSMPGSAVTAASGAGQAVTFTTPITLNASTSYIIRFTTNADIRNPLTTGARTLTVATSTQTTAGTSGSYSITTSSNALTVGAVTVSPNTIGNYGEYQFNITTSSDGALVAGTSTVSITFPAGTNVPAAYVAGDIRIGTSMPGTAVTVASGAGQVATFTTPINLNASTAYIVRFNTSADIRNPLTTGSRTLTAATSCQTSAGTSGSYSIGLSSTNVSVDSITPVPNTVGNQAAYTVIFDLSSDGGLVGGTSTITIDFNNDFNVLNGVLTGVTVNSVAATANGNGGGRTITVTVPNDIAAGTNNVTVYMPSTVVRNPNSSGDYTGDVNTSVQPAGTSPTFAIGASSIPIAVTSISLSTNVIDQAAQYTIDFDISSDGALTGGTSTITVTFQNDTLVTDGVLDNVNVEGVLCTSATGDSVARTIVIIPSNSFSGGTTGITLSIPSADVQNPHTGGNYTVDVETFVQPTGTSPQYTIGQSATAISGVTATPNPTVVGQDAAYLIEFDTSADGALDGGLSEIIIIFPIDTDVTNGALGGIVQVEGVGVTSATGNRATRTITIIPSQDFAASYSGITVSLSASDVRNPSTLGGYTLTVATSPQPAGTSGTYTMVQSGTSLSVGTVTPSPNTIGNLAAYTIDFNTGTQGQLVGGASEIVVTFPAGTTVPTAAFAGVTVEGTGADSAVGNAAARTVTIVPNQTISAGTPNVTIFIPQVNNIRNPITDNPYTLTVGTTPQPAGDSNNYDIGFSSTNVNVTSVTPNPTTIGNQSAYTIDFDTSADGGLVGGTSTITVVFPNDTLVTEGVIAGITVEGTGVASATGTAATRTIVITPAQNINASQSSITIYIPASEIRNPTTVSAVYTLTVTTSVQPAGISPFYNIGQSASSVAVGLPTANPATVGNPAIYTIPFTTSSDGALLSGTSTITIVFPVDTAVFNGGIAGITVNGNVVAGTGVFATRTISLTTPISIAGNTGVTVVIPAIGVTNPTTLGNYSLTVATSVQPAGISSLYGIGLSSNNVNVTSVAPTPSTVGNAAAYSVQFTTSLDGAISTGGNIFITLPVDTFVPTGAMAGILINGIADASTIGNTGSRLLTITTAAPISGSTTVTVAIPLAAGLVNPTTTGSYTLTVATTAQPSGISPAYTIDQSGTAVSVTSVTPSPTTVGSDAGYTVNFTTGSSGPLYAGSSHIIITLPANTVVPIGAIGGITVNGIAPTTATGSMSPAQIDLLISANINASTPVSVIIPSPEIQNPTSAGTYILTVETSAQPAGNSPGYSITISGTTVNVTAVSLSDNVVNTLASYTVNITPAVVLRGTLSSIFMVFPPNATVPDGAIANVSVGGSPATSAVGNSASRTISIIPSTDISASTDTPIVIANPVIMNPSYPLTTNTMSVSTTAQPMGTRDFTINPSWTTHITALTVSPNPTTAGTAAEYTINFTVGALGRLGPGSIIYVEFPTGTVLPGSAAAGTITVNGVGTTGTTYSDGMNLNVCVPTTVPINGTVALIYSISADVRNPSERSRIDDVHTDAEPTPATSNYYDISVSTTLGTPVVTPNPSSIFSIAEYTVVFDLGAQGSLNAGTTEIGIIFPNQVTLPTSFTPSDITVNGTPVLVAVRSGQIMRIISPIQMLAGASSKTITIIFSTDFGITNPAALGSYTLQAYTTIEPTFITSDPFDITASTATQITTPQVDLSPASINSYGRYIITFNVGPYGALVRDQGSFEMVFPVDFVLPVSIAATSIVVNNQQLNDPPTINGQTLTILSPVNVPLSGSVEIQIFSSARIQNRPTEGTVTFQLATSSEPNLVESNTVFIRRVTWDDVTSFPNPMKYHDSHNKAFTFLFVPDQEATLRIYTLDGRLVKTVTKNDTTDQMIWYLMNEKEKLVASGIYIYVIKGTSGEKKGKIAFLK